MKHFYIYLCIFFIAAIAMTSCNKEGCTDPEAINFDVDAKKSCASCCVYDTTGPADNASEVNFIFRNYIGPASLSPGNIYFINNRAASFSVIQYYISNISFIKEDGSEIDYNDYLLVNPENNAFELGEIEPGAYKGFRFLVGLDSAANHTHPDTYPAGHPLGNQADDMHWTMNQGYIFLKLEGLVDTSAVADTIIDFKWKVHIGSDNFLRTVEVARDFTVQEGVDINVNMEVDYAELFDGIDFGGAELSTMTSDDFQMALKLANNIPEAFGLDRHQ